MLCAQGRFLHSHCHLHYISDGGSCGSQIAAERVDVYCALAVDAAFCFDCGLTGVECCIVLSAVIVMDIYIYIDRYNKDVMVTVISNGDEWGAKTRDEKTRTREVTRKRNSHKLC